VPVIAVRWSGVGKGSGEEAVPPPQKNFSFLELKIASFHTFLMLFL